MAYSLAYTKINGFAVIYHLSALKIQIIIDKKKSDWLTRLLYQVLVFQS